VAKNDAAMANVLASALSRRCTFWGRYTKADDAEDFDLAELSGLVVTAVDREPVTNFKRLLVFSFWTDNSASKQEIIQGIDTLERYAEGENCSLIYAITENPQLESVLKSFGWNTSETLVYKPL